MTLQRVNKSENGQLQRAFNANQGVAKLQQGDDFMKTPDAGVSG